ncbi:MAG: chloride channel protein, partial [Candidatus Marinimicrobia bacterium]|nr:chloride channel protein [Candidatus Neomarinimicrobiota bacterium]
MESTIKKILPGLKSYDHIFVLVVAAIIGVVGGFIAAGFQYLIAFFRDTLWTEGNIIEAITSTPLYLRLAIPAVGGLIVAWFVHKLAPEAKGHGVPEVMNAVATHNGFIRMRVVLVKAFASALTIASGGSVGREGPIVQIGSAFGSTMGQIFQVSRRRLKTFVGCGAAAGIAATFNAPIAGAIFASEIILGDFSAASIGPLMIASVLGTVVSHNIYGDYPAFIPPVYSLNNPIELVFYAVLGVAAGLIGLAFIKLLYYSEDFFDRFHIHVALKAMIGGLGLGIIALFVPQIMGVGYETIDLVLAGNLSIQLALLFLLAKLAATSLTLGFGGSGGIFAPSLFMGSMVGGAIGSIFGYFFPEMGISPGAYALVGMAAVVSATTFAPITAILIIFELTMEYTVILPVMIASIIALVITQNLAEGSIYTIKL